MRIAVIGCGYVGLAVAVGLARAGKAVTAVERDPARLEALRAGRVPIDEPGLQPHLARIRFTGALAEIGGASLVLVAVPTADADDLRRLGALVGEIGAALQGPSGVVALKSTVPPDRVDAWAADLERAAPGAALVVSPEFLRQGAALADFCAPARVVLGGPPAAVDVVLAALDGVIAPGVPVIRTDRRTAALAKLAANAMLAVRVALGNELLRLGEALGADHAAVIDALGRDPRIGPAHLQPSLGFGGGCLPKDARMLAEAGRAAGVPLGVVAGATASNDAHQAWILEALTARLGAVAGRRIAVWGVSFKPGTADRRGSAAWALCLALRARGATVVAHDPAATGDGVLGGDPAAAVDGADALVVGTAWPAYREVDPAPLRPTRRCAFDPAGLLDPARWTKAGFSLWPTPRSP